jgi:hypothetical protein
MLVGGQPHAPAASARGKDPVPIVQEAGWAPGPVWTGAENLASTGVRSTDRLALSQSLYRLRYPAHPQVMFLPQCDRPSFTPIQKQTMLQFCIYVLMFMSLDSKLQDIRLLS